MFIVHKKGLKLDGDNPTILYGYGGFNVSQTPTSPTLFPWFEAGGVYAIANLRGGGEFGASWHRAGMLENKQNVFDDFIAAAEWLIANKYTNPDRLGDLRRLQRRPADRRAVTQRPDLFRAAICAVPLLDMLRYQDFLMARYWVPEYGTAENPEQFEWLRAYSPYHNVKPARSIRRCSSPPARTTPASTRCTPARWPRSCRRRPPPPRMTVRSSSGSIAMRATAQGKPLHLRVRDAPTRMFLMWQLGMLPPRLHESRHRVLPSSRSTRCAARDPIPAAPRRHVTRVNRKTLAALASPATASPSSATARRPGRGR
jgi:hypothetical protein